MALKVQGVKPTAQLPQTTGQALITQNVTAGPRIDMKQLSSVLAAPQRTAQMAGQVGQAEGIAQQTSGAYDEAAQAWRQMQVIGNSISGFGVQLVEAQHTMDMNNAVADYSKELTDVQLELLKQKDFRGLLDSYETSQLGLKDNLFSRLPKKYRAEANKRVLASTLNGYAKVSQHATGLQIAEQRVDFDRDVKKHVDKFKATTNYDLNAQKNTFKQLDLLFQDGIKKNIISPKVAEVELKKAYNEIEFDRIHKDIISNPYKVLKNIDNPKTDPAFTAMYNRQGKTPRWTLRTQAIAEINRLKTRARADKDYTVRDSKKNLDNYVAEMETFGAVNDGWNKNIDIVKGWDSFVANEYQEKMDDATNVYHRVHEINNLPIGERAAHVKLLKPKAGDPDFKRAQESYEKIKAQTAKNESDLIADPMADDTVKRKLALELEGIGKSESYAQTEYDVAMDIQKQLQIPKDMRRSMTLEKASFEKEKFLGLDNEKKLKYLLDAREIYKDERVGHIFRQIFGETNMYRVVANFATDGPTSIKAKKILSYIDFKLDEVKKGMEPDDVGNLKSGLISMTNNFPPLQLAKFNAAAYGDLNPDYVRYYNNLRNVVEKGMYLNFQKTNDVSNAQEETTDVFTSNAKYIADENIAMIVMPSYIKSNNAANVLRKKIRDIPKEFAFVNEDPTGQLAGDRWEALKSGAIFWRNFGDKYAAAFKRDGKPVENKKGELYYTTNEELSITTATDFDYEAFLKLQLDVELKGIP